MGLLRTLFIALLIGGAIGYYVVKTTGSHSYPEAVEAGFIAQCQSGGTRGECECLLEKLQEKYSLSEFQALMTDVSSGQREDDVLPLARECAGR